jgi:acetylornithine deacetylase/succinyl-diaminopimelate desuccinylase-like protein
MTQLTLLILAATLAFAAPLRAQGALSPYQQLGRDVLKELVETNTEHSIGSTTKAVELMAARFVAAGFPAADVQIVGPDGPDAKDKNLVVRYRGAGARKPVLLIGHLDVVEAKPSDWVLDPFTLTEKDGHFYGRGTLDMKTGDASWVVALLRMKQENVVPAGDFILALTAGEEGPGYNGIQWLLTNKRDLIDAQYVMNADAGGGELRNGKPIALDVQAAEKVFHSVSLTARNPGGHSSLPRKDNAIYALSAALGRLSAYEFPFRTNPVTRSYFTRAASLVVGDTALAADMRAVGAKDAPDPAAARRLAARSAFYNAQLRTTCVATLLQGGHAENALPQSAQATVNCRMLPGTDPAEVVATIKRVIADTIITVAQLRDPTPSGPSPLPADLDRVIQQVTQSVWGPLTVVQNMETGATDGLFLRNVGVPVYGISGLFADPTIDDDNRAHGLNERIGVKAFYDQIEFTYRLLKALDRPVDRVTP